MKRLFIVLSLLICSFSSVAAQAGYGTGGGFNPDNPGIPGANGLYLDNGLVVIDGLQGSDDGISEAIYSLWRRYCDEQGYGEYSNERDENHMLEVFDRVNTVIVCADFTSNQTYNGSISIADNIGEYFRKMTTLDLSRTTGWTSEYSLSEGDNLENLEVLILPDCVEEVVSMADLHKLTDVFCYAELPPTLIQWTEWYTRPLFADDTEVTVHVPDSSVPLYKASDTWGKYDIVGMDANIGKIEVKMPQNVYLQQYRNMWLTLTDETTQLMTRYVVTDRQDYFFAGINGSEDITYSVALVNRFGTVVCQQTGVKPVKGTTVVQLKDPKPVTIVTPHLWSDGNQDVTDMVTLTWFTPQGERITSSPSLAGVVTGDVIDLEVKLPVTMLQTFAPPERMTITIPEIDSYYHPNLPVLKTRKRHAVVGFVRDADSHQPLHELTVTAIQEVTPGVTNTYNSLTYTDGRFIVQCFEGPLTISLSSKEYLRRDLQFDIYSSTPDEYLVGDYFLRRASGKTINLDISHTRVGVGEPSEPLSYFSDYQDVHVSVYNESQGGELLRNVSVQLPQVVVLTGADDGDELRIEMSSLSGLFDTFSVTANIENGSATVPVNIVDRGGFRSTFTSTQNGSVAAIVYDSEGQFVNYNVHKKATLDVKGLPEGDYTLVTMAYDPVVNRLSNLQAFQDMGLQQNRDYLLRTFHVSPGILTVIDQGEVPVINLDELRIIHPSSTFSLSEQQVTVGDYVTVRARVKVKNEIAQNSWGYGNFRLLFDLPTNSRYLRGSLMVDGQLATPDFEDDRLLVNAEGLQEGKVVDVRFCFVAKDMGEHTVSALVGYRQYDWQNGDKDYFSPVGAATYEAIPMKYHILAETTGNFIASGNGPTDAIVRAYEDGTLLGQTTIAGKVWSINVPLPSTYNLSIHNIYLECETKEGNIYTTPTTAVMVNFDINAVNRVTMIYPNAFSQKTEVCTWEFREPDTRVESYDYYPSSTSFTFLTEFLHNDTTEIDNVRLRVQFENRTSHDYPAVFDEERGCWVTAIEVLESPPVSVAVSYDRKKPEKHVDRRLIDDFWQNMQAHVATYNQLTAIISSANEDNIDQKIAEAEALLGVSLSAGEPDAEMRERMALLETMSAEEISEELQRMEEELNARMEEMDNLLKDSGTAIDIKGTYTLEDGTVFSVTDCSAYSEATIMQQGFQPVTTTDGSKVYMLTEGTRMVMVDFKNNYATEMNCVELAVETGPYQARPSLEAMVNKCITFLKECVVAKIIDVYNSVFDKVTNAMKFLLEYGKYLDEMEFSYRAALNNPTTSMVDKVKARAILATIKIGKMLNQKKIGHIKFVSNLLGKLMIVPNYIVLFQKYSKIANTYKACDEAIPNPCPKMEEAAMNIRMMIDSAMSDLLFYCLGELLVNLSTDIATLMGVGLSVETFGVSLLISAASILLKTAAQWAMNNAVESNHMNHLVLIRACIRNLECDEEPEPEEEGEPEEPYTPDKKPLHDPSGFVCEAVESNRLEGVTATCFFKKEVQDMYGDKHEEVTIWDAENYGQVNPQLTDRDGMYAWMVPAGSWQVLYEKDGYETQRSPWLPVPPPQLDVNVGMVRRAQPSVLGGQAYEKAVDIDFSLYMKANYITPQTVTFWQDGQQLKGELKATNGEAAFTAGSVSTGLSGGEGPQCASTFRFVPKKALAAGSMVTVRISGLCRSYADVPMGNDQELTLTVGREVTSIGSDGNIIVPYGGTHQVVITAKSAQAAAFRQVTISSISPDIAALQTDKVVLDAEGKAYITVIGRLPGTTYLTFAVEGSQVSGMDTVRVVSQFDVVAAPQASLISGTYVNSGTQVELTAQPGCTIWYTLDGTCPCDAATRRQYTGPITITANTTLRAMAIDEQGRESEVVTFTWFIGTGIASPAVGALPAATYDLQGRRRQHTDAPAAGEVLIIDGRKVTGTSR